jgi:hypothetical protein
MDTDLVCNNDHHESSAETEVIPALLERVDEIRHYLYNGWKEGLMYDYIPAAAIQQQQQQQSSIDSNFFTRLIGSNKTTSHIWSLMKAVLPKSRSSSDGSDVHSSDLVQMISLLDHHLQIEKKYDPMRIGSQAKFDIYQFRPVTSDGGESTAPSTPRGWDSLTRGKVTIIDVPNANHYNIIRPPAVEVLSTVITARLMGREKTVSDSVPEAEIS